MVVQVDIERAVSSTTHTEKKIVYHILSKLDLESEKTSNVLNIANIRKEIGAHISLMTSSLKFLTILDVISIEALGKHGSAIYVLNAEACKELKKILEPVK